MKFDQFQVREVASRGNSNVTMVNVLIELGFACRSIATVAETARTPQICAVSLCFSTCASFYSRYTNIMTGEQTIKSLTYYQFRTLHITSSEREHGHFAGRTQEELCSTVVSCYQ